MIKTLEFTQDFNPNLGLIALGKKIQANARSKMANVSGEQRKQTIVGSINWNHVIVAVNVVYGAYQEEGQRRDGTYKIRNRTSPGEDHAMKKSALEADLDVMVTWVNYELKNKLK